MDSSDGSSGAPPPFLTKTYEMVDDPLTNSTVSWSQTGFSFVVWNPPEFARDLLPIYFKHNNFSSFVRQLNTYGFRKIDREQWEFANDGFIRGRIDLLKSIHRRKPIFSHSHNPSTPNHGGGAPFSDQERRELEDRINALNHENTLLQLHLQQHQKEKEEIGLQIHSLCRQLRRMANQQKQLITDLQNPGFVHTAAETYNKRRRLFKLNEFQRENEDLNCEPLELAEKLESSIELCESLVYSVAQWVGEDESKPSTILTKEMVGPIGDLKVVVGREDVLPAGANDFFWEQFLTEIPGSSDTGKLYLDRRSNVMT